MLGLMYQGDYFSLCMVLVGGLKEDQGEGLRS